MGASVDTTKTDEAGIQACVAFLMEKNEMCIRDRIQTGQEAPDDGARHGEQEGADECRKQSHEITPFLKAHWAREMCIRDRYRTV